MIGEDVMNKMEQNFCQKCLILSMVEKEGSTVCQIERVRYRKCPLVEVAYQLNFPTILSIEAEMPVKFQNEIRKAFPQYQMQTEQENEITVNITGEDVNPMFRHRPVRKLHQFISEDGMWKITLAKNQLAISTLKYEQWEDMMSRFEQPLKAFSEVYDQSYFERVGLRYVDAIKRSELGLEGVEWKELIRPHLLGCLSFSQEEVEKVNLNTLRAEIVMDGVSVRVSSGLGIINTDNKEPDNAFILDCDYYQIGKVDMDKIGKVAECLHQKSTEFFRKSITRKLHEAMNPQELK